MKLIFIPARVDKSGTMIVPHYKCEECGRIYTSKNVQCGCEDTEAYRVLKEIKRRCQEYHAS